MYLKEARHTEKETVTHNKSYFDFSQNYDASYVQKDIKTDHFLISKTEIAPNSGAHTNSKIIYAHSMHTLLRLP
jgi:hypothetical protein